MSAGWVAGCVRARALSRRRLGSDLSRRLAGSGSLDEALRSLAGTAYGDRAHPGLDLATAEHAIAGCVLWDLRVLAGWLPADGVRMLRTLASWFELANTEEMLTERSGPVFELGALATAWPRLRAAGPAGLRAALAASSWQDPAGGDARSVRLAMRSRWAQRVAALGEPARSWAAGAAAVLAAGELLASRTVPAGLRSMIGPAAAVAGSLPELTAALSPPARWALAGIESAGELWEAEPRWRGRVEQDGARLLRGSALNGHVVLGAVALLACDALRVRAALEVAARGSTAELLRAFDEFIASDGAAR